MAVVAGHQLEGRRHAFSQVENIYIACMFPWCVRIYAFVMHAAVQFSLSTVTVGAESVNDSTPAARVTWSTTIPSECVTAVTVEFRTDRLGDVVGNYTTTNTSQTEIIQTGLQCAAFYYIRVVITGETSDGERVTQSSNQVQVLVGGKEIVWMFGFSCKNVRVSLSLHRYSSPSCGES